MAMNAELCALKLSTSPVSESVTNAFTARKLRHKNAIGGAT